MNPTTRRTLQEIWDQERNREYLLVENACATLGRPVRFLEVGCGRLGLLTEDDRLLELREHAIGIDVDLEALGVNCNVRYRLGADCYDIPFRSESINVVVCRWLFEHLDNPDRAMGELSRVLCAGGFLLVTTPNLLNYAMLLSKYTPTRVHNLIRRWSGSHDNTKTFYRANTARQLTRLAKAHGLIIRHMELVPYSYMYFGFNPVLFQLMKRLSSVTSKVTSRLHLRIVCLMEKTAAGVR